MMMSLGHICTGVPLSILGCFIDFDAGLLTLVLSLLTSTAIARPRFIYNVATGVIMILLFSIIGPLIPNNHALAPSLRTPLRAMQPVNYITYFSYIIMFLAAFTYTMESYLRIQFCVRWQFKMGKKAMERAKHAEGTKDAKSSFLR